MNSALISSRAWPYRIVRIVILSALGWWLVETCCLPGYAQFPPGEEWPKNDFSQRTVAMEEITSGGPSKDGIPAVDKPRFESAMAATHWLTPEEPVIVLALNNKVRAYPLQILIYHEIVNDEVGGVPVTVTFCPLCYSAIVFDRRLNGQTLDFGTTGRVRKSDLVMYDRQTESWWQQLTGQGIVGKYAGATLRKLPSTITSFEVFRSAWPSGRVLSRNTGFVRPYGNNPYTGYDNINSQPFLFDGVPDSRLPPMERVLAVELDDGQRVYPFSVLGKNQVINDALNGQAIVIFGKPDVLSAVDAAAIRNSQQTLMAAAYSRETDTGILTFRHEGKRFMDNETGSHWNIFGTAIRGKLKGQQLKPVDSGVHFAFAWLAFHPETDIYK